MSRNYEVQVEVFPCAYEEEPRVSDLLVQWGMEFESDIETYDPEHGDGHSYWGQLNLVDDQTEEQRHGQLREFLPDRYLVSRWRGLPDDTPWDDVIETEALKPRK